LLICEGLSTELLVNFNFSQVINEEKRVSLYHLYGVIVLPSLPQLRIGFLVRRDRNFLALVVDVQTNHDVISIGRVIQLIELADQVVPELFPNASDILHTVAASDSDNNDLEAV
jgi:hypothetical protein